MYRRINVSGSYSRINLRFLNALFFAAMESRIFEAPQCAKKRVGRGHFYINFTYYKITVKG